MTSIALQTAGSLQAPKLRLLPARSGAPKSAHASTARSAATHRGALRLFSRPASRQRPVLIAGGDAIARASLLRDLAQTMPQSTVFEQAGAVWEVLARAGDSSVVILGGELEDVSAESLMQMLAHRHPGLPVVSLDSQDTPLAAPAATSVAC
jgi:hypothetical protein